MSSRVRLYQNACNHTSVRHLKWKRKISKGKSKDCGYGPVSMKGGKRVRFCCNSHWMSWVCWPRRQRGPSWCVCVGGSVGRGMAALTPGISSLSFSGFCIRLLQGSPAGHLYQWCYRLGGGERPMLVPTRARHSLPSVLVVPDCSSGLILSLFTFMSSWSSFCSG